MKTTLGAKRLLFPSPVALVATGTLDESNIVTIAWVSLLTSKPPSLGISVGTRGFSGEAIKRNKHFTVNIASADIMVEADFCGISSGKDLDKFAASGLTKLPSVHVDSPIIAECPLNLECRLVQWQLVGQTNHFVGEILETHVDTRLLKNASDHASIDIDQFNPLIYFGGVREYRIVGEKIGDAYQVGNKLKK